MPFFGFGGAPQGPKDIRLDPARSARLDAAMARQIRHGEPALAIAVVKDGAPVHVAAYGLADMRGTVAATSGTMFHLASCGKQLTGLGILMLVEAGRLGLDDPVGRYIPAVAGFGPGVIIRRLLHHTSGIRDLYDDKGFETVLDFAARPTNADVCAVYANLRCPLVAAPGERFIYSNSGYELLGAVIETASGERYADFFRRRVFDPLGMKDTFSAPDRRMNDRRRAVGYGIDDDGFYPHEGSPFDDLVGAGSFVSTVVDLCVYDRALAAFTLVNEASMRAALTTGITTNGKPIDYGFGWQLGRYKGMPYAGHDGDWTGFYSYIRRYKDRPLSVYALSNHPDIKPEDAVDAATDAFG